MDREWRQNERRSARRKSDPEPARPGPVPGRGNQPDWRQRQAAAIDPSKADSMVESRATLEPEAPRLEPRALAKARRANPRYLERLDFDPFRFGGDLDVGSADFACAVAAYQGEAGLTVDGIAGPITCEAIGALPAAPESGEAKNTDLEQGEARGAAALAPSAVDPDKQVIESRATLSPADLDRPIQRRAAGSAKTDDLHTAAARGIAGPGAALPHAARIQAAFGRHDIAGVRAHIGGKSADAADAIGAEAYATGRDLAFRAAPDLETTAHEAAHAVHQRAGVSLKGGIGEPGDRYEQNADAVAAAVVRGESAEGLLDQIVGAGAKTSGAAVQRKESASPSEDVRSGLFGRKPGNRSQETTVGTPISLKTPSGNPNTVTGQMNSVILAWDHLLEEQLKGVKEFEQMTLAESPAKRSPWVKQAVRLALFTAFTGVTGRLAAAVSATLQSYLESAASSESIRAIDIHEIRLVTMKAHRAISSPFAKEARSRVLSGSTDAALAGHEKQAFPNPIEGFVRDLENGLSTMKPALAEEFVSRQGDFEALETKQSGAGFSALEGYRNALRTEALSAKKEQKKAAMSAWLTTLARGSLAGHREGHRGTIDNDEERGTDLSLPGGIATDETMVLGERELWAEGVLVLDMDWWQMQPIRSRVRGISDAFKASLGAKTIGELEIPMIARGNVRGDQRPNQPGEFRISRNESGDVDAIVIETREKSEPIRGELLPDRQVARFIRRVAGGQGFERDRQVRAPSAPTALREPLPSTPAEQLAAARTIFADHLARLRVKVD